MRLAASLVVRNELDRYLEPCIAHLLDFCDMVVVLDDASDDGTREFLVEHPDDRVHVVLNPRSTFYEHEGRTRQILVDATLGFDPTYVLTLDADEFVSDGIGLRAMLAEQAQAVPVWSLQIEEIWKATPDVLLSREDGGWRSHPLSVLWSTSTGREMRMLDRKLACRRVPKSVLDTRAHTSHFSLLHFGWADPATRQRRYDRYAKHDGGRFHASRHLQSILWDDRRVQLRPRAWPAGPVFDGLRGRLAGVAPLPQ